MAKVKLPILQTERQWAYDYSDNLTQENISEILEDEQIKSNINTLISGIGQAETIFKSDGVSDVVDEFIRSLFDETDSNYFDWGLFKEQMFSMLARKSSVIRLIWNDSQDMIKSFINLKADNYSFNELGDLVDSQSNLMMPKPEYKYLYHVSINKPDAYNRFGKSLFNKSILNLVRIKKMLNPKMYDAIDASISEPLIAFVKESVNQGYDITTTTGRAEFEAAIDGISDNLRDIRSGGAMATNSLDSVTTLKTKPDAALFEKFFGIINSCFSVAILGTDKTTNAQERGSYASDKVGQDIQVLVTRDYSRIFNKARNQIIRKIVDVRFGVDVPATEVSYNYPDSYSIEQLTAMHQAGIATKKEKWGDVLPDADTPEDQILQPQQIMQFAEKKKTIKRPLIQL